MPERRYRPSLVGPLILITAGVLLLLNQFNQLPWDIWGTLWRFWPVFLILVGIEVLVGTSRSVLLYLAGLALAVVVLAVSIGYAIYQSRSVTPPMGRSETVQEALQDADRGLITLAFGTGTLDVGALPDGSAFVAGIIDYGRNSLAVDKQASAAGGQVTLSLKARGQPSGIWTTGDTLGDHWTLQLTPHIPLEIHVDTGFGRARLDLTRLRITQLDIRSGIGDLTLTMPSAAGTTRASINVGIGAVTVRIPSGVAARIQVERGLTSLSVDTTRFRRDEDTYASRDYEGAANRIELYIRGGIGTVRVQ